jgi:hypothetical protein
MPDCAAEVPSELGRHTRGVLPAQVPSSGLPETTWYSRRKDDTATCAADERARRSVDQRAPRTIESCASGWSTALPQGREASAKRPSRLAMESTSQFLESREIAVRLPADSSCGEADPRS